MPPGSRHKSLRDGIDSEDEQQVPAPGTPFSCAPVGYGAFPSPQFDHDTPHELCINSASQRAIIWTAWPKKRARRGVQPSTRIAPTKLKKLKDEFGRLDHRHQSRTHVGRRTNSCNPKGRRVRSPSDQAKFAQPKNTAHGSRHRHMTCDWIEPMALQQFLCSLNPSVR